MRFRTRSLFVMMATVAVVLALTGSSPIPLRIGIVVSVMLTWLGIGLVGMAAPHLAQQRYAPVLIGMLGVLLAATAISLATMLTGVAFESQFMK